MTEGDAPGAERTTMLDKFERYPLMFGPMPIEKLGRLSEALGRAIADDDVVLIEDYAYPAYGIPSAETNDAIRLCARTEGMMTDPVYEGKSMQGLIDLVRKGFFPAGSKVLYAHLGGVPAINAYSYVYRNG